MENEEPKTTTIAIKLATRERILNEGKMGESFDDVINRALDALAAPTRHRVRKEGKDRKVNEVD
jgi:hypothetical protein